MYIVFGGGFVLFILVIWAVLNSSSLKNFFQSGRAQLGKAGRWAKQVDPVAIHQQAIDDAENEVREANTGLASIDKMLIISNREVNRLTEEKQSLEKKIKTALANNDPNKTLDGYAIEFGQVEKIFGYSRKEPC